MRNFEKHSAQMKSFQRNVRRSHAQYTAKVKQEEAADTKNNIDQESSKRSGRKERGHEGKKS